MIRIMTRSYRRIFIPVLIACIGQPLLWSQQPAPMSLNLIILQGEGAINNIRLRTTMQPIIEVTDENHKPVAGAVVMLESPTTGPGGTFAGGAHTLQLTTNAQGRAIVKGFHANKIAGRYQLVVHAASNGAQAQAVIAGTNAVLAGGLAIGTGLLTTILVVGGVAVAGGTVAAIRSGGTAPAATTVALGAPSVTAP